MVYPTVGFIGSGTMGKPMAMNLLKAGYPLVVYDHKNEVMENLSIHGASPTSSYYEVAKRSNTIIMMLPDSVDCEEAVLGWDGVLEGAQSGSTIVFVEGLAQIDVRRSLEAA